MTGLSQLLSAVSKMRAVGVTPSRIVAGTKAYDVLRYGCLIPPWGGEFRLLGLPVERREDCHPNVAYILSTNVDLSV